MTKKSAKPAAKKTATKAPAKATKKEKEVVVEVSKIAKTQIVELVTEKSTLTKKQTEEAVSVMLEVIVEALKNGQTVGLPGLGTLSVKPTAARTGVRPGTSEKIQIPAGKKVAFKVASTLKNSIGQ